MFGAFMANFEMTFMAIASKNGFLTHEEAAEALTEVNDEAGAGSKQTIEDIVLAHGLLTADQVRVISTGAKKILGVQTRPVPAAPPSPPPRGPPPPPRRHP